MHKVHRYHDICAGHSVTSHEGKCRHLHGHNYRIHFTCVSDSLDEVGRVIDFSVVKEKLCMWVEETWDHHFLIWEQDKRVPFLKELDNTLVVVPFNPTAENMAQYLVESIGPRQLEGTGVKLLEVMIEETAKCHASYCTGV
jgi:6-pyruvoyltetrahydropterin/6-carboxytetrahydropterin synthase